MLEASTEFSKSGYDAQTSAQLAQTATLFQNIADSEVSAGDAASFIISQMKAFGIEANDAVSILDKVNETSNNFSVKMQIMGVGLVRSLQPPDILWIHWRVYNSIANTSKGVLFLPPSDAYVRSFLYLLYTLIKLYYTKALSGQASPLAPV